MGLWYRDCFGLGFDLYFGDLITDLVGAYAGDLDVCYFVGCVYWCLMIGWYVM